MVVAAKYDVPVVAGNDVCSRQVFGILYADSKLDSFILVAVKESAESVRVPIPQESSDAVGSGQSRIPGFLVELSGIDNCDRPAIDEKTQTWEGVDLQEGEVVVRWSRLPTRSWCRSLLTGELLLMLVLLAEELVSLPISLLTVSGTIGDLFTTTTA